MNIKEMFTPTKILKVNDYTGKETELTTRYYNFFAKILFGLLNKRASLYNYYIVDPQLVIKKDISSQSGDNTGALQGSKKTGRDPLDPC